MNANPTGLTTAPPEPPREHRFSAEQRTLILRTCCGGASEQEASALIAIAEQRGLNPLTGECYFVKRWDSAKRQEVWSVQASIDSFRIKADETGLYDGQDEPEFEYEPDGTLKLARVRVYRKGWSRPSVGVARLDEYEQTTRDKQSGQERPSRFWARMPHTMLAKCAEALAFRKAFPARFAGIYTADEMAQAQGESTPHDAETGEVKDEEFARFQIEETCTKWRLALERAGDLMEWQDICAEIARLVKAKQIPQARARQLRTVAELQRARLIPSTKASENSDVAPSDDADKGP